MAHSEKSPGQGGRASDGAGSGFRRALVVDDEVLVTMAVADQCRDLGMEVFEAFRPEEALAILDRQPGIEALITDVRMPGMTGPELVRQAMARHAGLAVVFITGFALDEGRTGLPAPWPVLRKPFDLAALGPALARAARLR